MRSPSLSLFLPFHAEYRSGRAGICLKLRREACRMLLYGDWPISRIAVRTGFADQSHFTALFRREFGRVPALCFLIAQIIRCASEMTASVPPGTPARSWKWIHAAACFSLSGYDRFSGHLFSSRIPRFP